MIRNIRENTNIVLHSGHTTPGGVTLIFYIYIGLADIFGQNFEIQYFWGFQKNHYFLGSEFLKDIFWGSAH